MQKGQELFQKSLEEAFPDVEDFGNKLLGAALKAIKLPDNVSFSGNQMGIVFGENVTKEQLGEVTASLVSAMAGQKQLEGALQFVMGDLVNESVSKGLYRSRNDAQGAIKFIIKERLKKNYDVGTLNYYALMANRVKPEKRVLGIAPSLYLTVSKAVVPRLKGVTAEKQTADDKEFEALRETLLNKVNSGELTAVKDVQKQIKDFKESKGIVQESPAEKKAKIEKLLRQFYFAHFIKEYLVDTESETATVKVEEKGNLYGSMHVSELSDLIEEAKNELQNLLIPNADEVIAGEKTEFAGTKDEKKTKVFLTYPFGELTDNLSKVKEEAELKEKQAKEKAEADKAAKATEKAKAESSKQEATA
jgi:hypothetical protein